MTLSEYKTRIDGFILREMEIKNFGARRLSTIIVNGFNSFAGGKQYSEQKLWPFSLDKRKINDLPKSEDLVKRDRELILKIWPDVKI